MARENPHITFLSCNTLGSLVYIVEPLIPIH